MPKRSERRGIKKRKGGRGIHGVGALPRKEQLGPDCADFSEFYHEFWGSRDASLGAPEQDLLFGVLILALSDAMHGPSAGGPFYGEHGRQLSAADVQREAREWFALKGKLPFEWGWIIDKLSLKAGTVRKLEMLAFDATERPRTRTLVARRFGRSIRKIGQKEDPGPQGVQYVRPVGRPRGRGRAAA